MQSLLDSCSYEYIRIDNDRYRNKLLITNIGNFSELSDFINFIDKNKDITHILSLENIINNALFTFPLTNLIFLELKTRARDLKKINLCFCPNLKIIVLNIKQIENKLLDNLPQEAEILIFKITHSDLGYSTPPAFKNLPITLKIIVFYWDYMYDLERKRRLRQQKNIMRGIKNCKIPSGCKIYFCIDDDIHCVEKLEECYE